MSKTVICKTKENYKKLFEDKDSLYPLISNLKSIEENSFDFDNRTNLDDFEWYKLENFASKDYATKEIKVKSSGADYDMASHSDAAGIEYIFELSDDILFFQKVTRNAFVKKRSFITLGERFKKCQNISLFQVNAYPDAIYDRRKDILYFRKLFSITKIFNGINEIYREATDAEVQSFLTEKDFVLSDGFSVDKVKIPNRKKIALVQDTFSKMSKQEKKDMFVYIKDYYPNLKLNNGKAQISNEDDLKNILYGLEERFYTTQISKEKRIANSITAAGKKDKNKT
ncbi:hypothetical protein [uncultured Treponema sp.]|uniref:hypothetical protein n=1 Tax=uncultured Treponema sp. TaxID=162155 RepID=UPI0025ECC64E|nr:hypothetical protein [uncultured Treponema sp.]